MKILLIGATGMVGSRILNEAVSRGHEVTATSRNSDNIESKKGVKPFALDVNDVDAVIKQAQSADVIISAVSPRNTADAVTEAEAFTESLISAQRKTGKRLLMVGGAASLHLPDGTNVLNLLPEEIVPEAKGMRSAYGLMVNEDIDFTVLAPAGMIAPGERTTNFRLGDRTMVVNAEGGMGNISTEDFAIAMLDEVESPQHFRTIFNVGY